MKTYKPLFIYRDATLQWETEGDRLTQNKILDLISKQIFKPLEERIIDKIYEFKYITNAHLETLLSNSPSYESTNFKSFLSKLVKKGFLNRFYITWTEEVTHKDQPMKINRRTPNFYVLSKSAARYCIKKNRYEISVEDYLDSVQIQDVFEKATTNQALVNYVAKVDISTQYVVNKDIYVKTLDTTIHIDGAVTLKPKDQTNKDFTIPFLFIPVRRSPNWQEGLTDRVSLLKYYFMLGKEGKEKCIFDSPPPFVLICEDDLHMKETFEALYQIEEVRDYLFFFTTDHKQMSESLSDTLSTLRYNDQQKVEILQHHTQLLE